MSCLVQFLWLSLSCYSIFHEINFAFFCIFIPILKQMAVCFSAEDNKIDAGTYFHSKLCLLADFSCFSAQNSSRICDSSGFSAQKSWKNKEWWWFFVDFSGQKKKISAECFREVRRKILKSMHYEWNSVQKSSLMSIALLTPMFRRLLLLLMHILYAMTTISTINPIYLSSFIFSPAQYCMNC